MIRKLESERSPPIGGDLYFFDFAGYGLISWETGIGVEVISGDKTVYVGLAVAVVHIDAAGEHISVGRYPALNGSEVRLRE